MNGKEISTNKKKLLALRDKNIKAMLSANDAYQSAVKLLNEIGKKKKKRGDPPDPAPPSGICESLTDLKNQLQTEGQTIQDLIDAINSLMASLGCAT